MSCSYAFKVTIDPDTSEPEFQQYDLAGVTDTELAITRISPRMGRFIKEKLVNTKIVCELVCVEHGVKGVAELTIAENEVDIVKGYASSKAQTIEVYVAENLMAAAIISAQSSDNIYIPGQRFSEN